MSERTGKCLCGAVSFRATIRGGIGACHCGQCRRWTGGGPFFAVSVEKLEMKGEERASAYHASTWGERAFCGTCGTTLWWKMQGGVVDSVAVGLLDDQSGLSVTEEIFVDYRQPWMPPFEGARQMTEAETLAKYEATSSGETT